MKKGLMTIGFKIGIVKKRFVTKKPKKMLKLLIILGLMGLLGFAIYLIFLK
jgi:hypothetical protein